MSDEPTLTEEEEIEQRFKKMAVQFASVSETLQQWKKAGNLLPACYREEPDGKRSS
jgi:hypothetical protein